VHATTFCTNCHDGAPAADILPDFTPTIDQQIDTNEYYTTVNKKHDVLPADQIFSSTAMSCKNCHQPHVNNATDPVANPDTGAALASYNIANAYPGDATAAAFNYDGSGTDLDPTNPLGYTGPTRTEPDYVEFCLTVATAPSVVAGSRNHGQRQPWMIRRIQFSRTVMRP
jgi:hypothetical protein